MSDQDGPPPTPPDCANQSGDDDAAATQGSQFAEHIETFLKRVDSLADTLPLTMTIQQRVLASRKRELEAFQDRHCQSMPDSDEILVPVDYLSSFRQLDAKVHRAEIAMSTIPRSFLVALISEYDAFLSSLIRSMYTVRPEMLKGSTKPFTFLDLLEFGSLEAVREHVIEKEAESVLRESHTKQFEWLEDKLKCKLRTDLHAWAPFIEITERRNLFVHNDGIVTRQYLKNCAAAKCDIDSTKIGDRLDVSHRYFIRAHETVTEIALKLGYVLWNKLESHSKPSPQQHLSAAVVYELVNAGSYRLAITMGTFGLSYMKPFKQEANRLILTLNLAQAHKWAGDQKACDKLIDIDWTATRNDFQLCVAVLRNDVNAAVAKMREIGPDARPAKAEYRSWPIFKEIRKADAFQRAFLELFGEPLNVASPADETKAAATAVEALPSEPGETLH